MTVTVIVRTTGRASLARALRSVAMQAVPGLEVCVVDAAGSGGVLRQIELPADLNVRVVGRGAPLQRAAAAQRGLDSVATRWALFLDDDDELLPGHLDKLLAAVRAHSQAVGATTGVVQCREGDEHAVLATWDRAVEPWQLLAANAWPIHAVLFDAQRVRQAGVSFDETLDIFEDWDFWLQVQQIGPVVHVPGISARYWVASNTAGAQSAAQQAQHGDAHYAAVWRKWWGRAPSAWWTEMWRAARDEPLLRSQWQQTTEALVQAERARGQTAQALVQTEQALSQARQSFDDLTVIDRARQAELSQIERDLEALRRQSREEQALRLQVERERDEARVAEQGARWHLQAVLGSRSWRAMSPLRWLGRQARRVWRLRDADARRHFWWRLRHRSYPRPAILAAVLPDPYERWMQAVLPTSAQAAPASPGIISLDGNTPRDHEQALAEIEQWPQPPLISVVMPVYNPPQPFWDEAIESLRAQWWPYWELCVADDASTDPAVKTRLESWAAVEPRIRFVSLPTNGHISAASNAALGLAQGSWVALFDQDDLLPPQALWRVAQALAAHPDAGLVYSDEDKVDESGRRFGPYFKPAFDIDLLRGQNMISHLGVYRRGLVQQVGGFRVGYEGSQDHDLALRCVEQLQPSQVVHIPRVLYHWRVHQHSTASGQSAKPYALDAGVRAVQDHLHRCGVAARVQTHPVIPHHVVVHDSPTGSAAGVRLLLWGDGAHEVAQDVPAAAQGRILKGLSVLETAVEPGWRAACARLKAWVAQAHSDASTDIPILLLWAPLLQSLPSDHAPVAPVAPLWAHLMEPGVGAVGWALRAASGALHDAGWVRQADGRLHPIAYGSGLETHGYYGQLCLAHRVSALQAGAVWLRASAMQQHAEGLALLPGWRAVWSPLVQWQGVPVTPVAVNGWARAAHLDEAPLVVEAANPHPAWTDPSFSPHLSVEHADHRLVTDGAAAWSPAMSAASAFEVLAPRARADR